MFVAKLKNSKTIVDLCIVMFSLVVLGFCVKGMFDTSDLTESLKRKSVAHKEILDTYFKCKGTSIQCRLYALKSVEMKNIDGYKVAFNDVEVHLDKYYKS